MRIFAGRWVNPDEKNNLLILKPIKIKT